MLLLYDDAIQSAENREFSGNHPYVDGNKRTGFIAAALFLEANGLRFTATEEEAVERTLALAAGAIEANEYAAWLELNAESS
ncbi:MAG: type II toxin-antitoxin system death-on-curing family toxin [Verrucomicrobia bacterium]|nr:type II toxin-antitoxin system death-on-curing family toxin [Verrucomicrobiota bacterium]